uniref:Squalene monooxygenase n=1 Tax=Trichophyton mentagrophytes TaxID=523103 RepID=A0A289Z3Y0_9EURO|nr:squalene epoxidase [Trichophyton mentagrophytes]
MVVEAPPCPQSGNGFANGSAKPKAYRDEAERRRYEHHEADVVIIGAGIAGCALAVALGNQGRSVILLERSLKEPDRIVGELLQPGGVRALEQLGLRDCLEGIDAVRTYGYDVIYFGNGVKIPFPSDANDKILEGRCFHHGRFIMRLREAAAANPNVTIVETKAVSTIKSTHTGDVLGVRAQTDGKQDFYFGPLTVVADGYASTFRKEYLPIQPVAKSKFWGLELIDAKLPIPGHGHVVLGDFPPILIYQIGEHETRILIDIPDNLPSASVANGGVKGHMRNVVLPSLPECIRPSFEAALEKGGFRSMPNSFLRPVTNRIPGLMFLGDSLNMRHPLTGGGMTVAFNDVVLLRNLLSPEAVPDLSDTKLVLKQLSKFHWQRKSLISVINILAQSLYSIFAAGDPNLKVLQRGCFRYFQLGLIDGPIGLLSGIIRSPLVLLRHFYSVAFLTIWLHLTSKPIYLLPLTLFECIIVFLTACRVILPFVFAELQS